MRPVSPVRAVLRRGGDRIWAVPRPRLIVDRVTLDAHGAGVLVLSAVEWATCGAALLAACHHLEVDRSCVAALQSLLELRAVALGRPAATPPIRLPALDRFGAPSLDTIFRNATEPVGVAPAIDESTSRNVERLKTAGVIGSLLVAQSVQKRLGGLELLPLLSQRAAGELVRVRFARNHGHVDAARAEIAVQQVADLVPEQRDCLPPILTDDLPRRSRVEAERRSGFRQVAPASERLEFGRVRPPARSCRGPRCGRSQPLARFSKADVHSGARPKLGRGRNGGFRIAGREKQTPGLAAPYDPTPVTQTVRWSSHLIIRNNERTFPPDLVRRTH